MRLATRTCRGCGCTDASACPGGCSWVLLDVDAPTGICSRCAEELEWDPLNFLAPVGTELPPAQHRRILRCR